jgi:hypothetical protein
MAFSDLNLQDYHLVIAGDSDHKTIIEEHETQGRGMSEYYQEIYEEAMRRLCTCKIGV